MSVFTVFRINRYERVPHLYRTCARIKQKKLTRKNVPAWEDGGLPLFVCQLCVKRWRRERA